MTIPIGARSFTVRFARIFGYFVYFWLLASLIILTLGFFLKLFAANPDAGFVEWVYRNLDRTMEPFRGMFPQQAVGDNGSILDVSILFAMLVYFLVAMGIRALIDWLTFRMHRLEREGAALELQQAAERATAVVPTAPVSAPAAQASPTTGAAASQPATPQATPSAPPASPGPASPFDDPENPGSETGLGG
jgi:uncharacterized protein YggT (Ycf19 family)